jgi:methionyl-tRNA synthetase
VGDRAGKPDEWKRWWQSPDTRLVHFIGKDNIPFHCVVFPAMLHGVRQNYVLPWHVPANEFYNLQGAKFSTSGAGTSRSTTSSRASMRRSRASTSVEHAGDQGQRVELARLPGRASNTLLADQIGNLVTRVLRFVDKNHAA